MYLLWSVYDGPNKDTIFLATFQFAICKTLNYFTTSNMEGVGDVTLGKLGSNVRCILSLLLIPLVCNQLKKYRSMWIVEKCRKYVRYIKWQNFTEHKLNIILKSKVLEIYFSFAMEYLLLWFTLWCCQYQDYSVKWWGKWWTGEHLGRSCHGPINILSWNLSGRDEEVMKNHSSDSFCPSHRSELSISQIKV